MRWGLCGLQIIVFVIIFFQMWILKKLVGCVIPIKRINWEVPSSLMLWRRN